MSNSKRRPPASLQQPQMKLTKSEIERRLLNSSRENCINWRGASIRTGDNLLLELEGESSLLIGQLIDIQDTNLIHPAEIKRANKEKRMALVRWFLPVDDKEARRPPVGERCQLPYEMKEVCQTTTAEWVKDSAVVNLCFIFHLAAIQKGYVSCAGMD
jgi:hypothetical protein